MTHLNSLSCFKVSRRNLSECQTLFKIFFLPQPVSESFSPWLLSGVEAVGEADRTFQCSMTFRSNGWRGAATLPICSWGKPRDIHEVCVSLNALRWTSELQLTELCKAWKQIRELLSWRGDRTSPNRFWAVQNKHPIRHHCHFEQPEIKLAKCSGAWLC